MVSHGLLKVTLHNYGISTRYQLFNIPRELLPGFYSQEAHYRVPHGLLKVTLRNYEISTRSVQSLSHVWLFATPWTTARQASLSIANSQSLPKPTSVESVMPSSHLILCYLLLLLPAIFPRIRVFSNESALRIRRPKYWSFSFNISPSNEHPGLISFRMD